VQANRVGGELVGLAVALVAAEQRILPAAGLAADKGPRRAVAGEGGVEVVGVKSVAEGVGFEVQSLLGLDLAVLGDRRALDLEDVGLGRVGAPLGADLDAQLFGERGEGGLNPGSDGAAGRGVEGGNLVAHGEPLSVSQSKQSNSQCPSPRRAEPSV
jgi:hypothetical protein